MRKRWHGPIPPHNIPTPPQPTPHPFPTHPNPPQVRLLTQCAHSLGYEQTARTLEEESGIPLCSQPVASFRSGILGGDWELVEGLVDELTLRTAESRVDVRFLILRQKFLELVEGRRTDEALSCLRHQLAPLKKQKPLTAMKGLPSPPACSSHPTGRQASPGDSGSSPGSVKVAGMSTAPYNKPPGADIGIDSAPLRATQQPPLHTTAKLQSQRPLQLASQLTSPEAASPQQGNSLAELSCFLMCKTAEELRLRSGWDGAAGQSRRLLLQQLQQHIPPSQLLPENRLQDLLEQAFSWQVSQGSDRIGLGGLGWAGWDER